MKKTLLAILVVSGFFALLPTQAKADADDYYYWHGAVTNGATASDESTNGENANGVNIGGVNTTWITIATNHVR